jgi:hydroxypyruvate isomerase
MGRMSRRKAIGNLLAGSLTAPVLMGFNDRMEQNNQIILKGNIRHAVCRWCYNDIPLEQFCAASRDMGISAIDLVGPNDWPTLKKFGLDSSMCNGAEINLVDGWNDTSFHEKLIRNYSEMIPKVAEAGYKNLICFSGNRRGKDDETGWKNCADGLKKVIGIAEKHGVTLVMELLNSKVNHKDYQCDKTSWGVELANRIGSPNFKLLYDIYHMQIDEGDVISTIRKYHEYIGHYHTGGVPGRHEIDETQELYYPAIMKAIVDTGFKGYVAQEFIPSWPDKLAALKKGVQICDI